MKLIEKKCPVCRKTFLVSPDYKPTPKTCGPCADKPQKKRIYKPRQKRNPYGTCKDCGEIIYIGTRGPKQQSCASCKKAMHHMRYVRDKEAAQCGI